MYPKILITACFLMVCAAVKPQTSPVFLRHEFGVGFGVGLSALNYQCAIPGQTNGFGGQSGLEYTYFLSQHWGINTGINVSLYTARATLDDGFGQSYSAISQGGLLPGQDFTYTYTVDGYAERQRAFYLSIPVMLQFQTTGCNQFYAASGVKFAFPFTANYRAKDFTLDTQGYFPIEGRTYNDLPDYGFGQYELSSKGTLDFGMAFLVSLEAGMKWDIDGNFSLYTGVYFDYGLNDIQKVSDRTFVEYSGSAAQYVQSLTQSQIQGQAIINNIIPMALGIKVKFVWAMMN